MTADRGGYTAGLRALADLLDANPHVPLPHAGSKISPLSIMHLSGYDEESRATERAAFAETVRAFPGQREKRAWAADSGTAYFDVDAQLEGLHVRVTAFRDTVCDRVVTGTREVTREIADPTALAAVPTVTVTETVDDVEWVCQPLLAPGETSQADIAAANAVNKAAAARHYSEQAEQAAAEMPA